MLKKSIVVVLVLFSSLIFISAGDKFVGKYKYTYNDKTESISIEKTKDGYLVNTGKEKFTVQSSTKEENEKIIGKELNSGKYSGIISHDSHTFFLIYSDDINEKIGIAKKGYYLFAIFAFLPVEKL
jgi:hypothetical protein